MRGTWIGAALVATATAGVLTATAGDAQLPLLGLDLTSLERSMEGETIVASGITATLAGRVVVMQAPPTAKGVMFLSLEDETGLGNAVLAPEILRRYRAALHAAPIVLVTGPVRRKGPVVSIQAVEIVPWWPDAAD